MLGDPAREALAEAAAQELHVDLFVRPDRPLERDRDDVRQLDEVDPGVVVIDDPACLLDDGPADLGDRGGPAEPRRGRLEDRELGGLRLGLLEQFGIRERDRRVGRERRDEGDVAARPVARIAGDRGQRADDAIVVDERRDQVAGEFDDPVVPGVAVTRVVANVRPGQHTTGAEDLADPTLVAMERRQVGRHLVRQARPRGDLEAVVLEDPDRRDVGSQGTLGLVDDGSEQLLAIVRGRKAFGDPEDGVEALGQLGFERVPGEDLGVTELAVRGRRVGRNGRRVARAQQALPDGWSDVRGAIARAETGSAVPPGGDRAGEHAAAHVRSSPGWSHRGASRHPHPPYGCPRSEVPWPAKGVVRVGDPG